MGRVAQESTLDQEVTIASNLTVPFLSRSAIVREAQIVLAQWERLTGSPVKVPVPIDNIVEMGLKLTLGFDDLRGRFGDQDVFGMIALPSGDILIDERLDPSENPSKLGRYRFTLAHECGHWVLHRKLFQSDPNQLHLLDADSCAANLVCRSGDSKSFAESQADQFAAALLMPEALVQTEWESVYGTRRFHPDDIRLNRIQLMRQESIKRSGLPSNENELEDVLFEGIARPLAKRFEVSTQAIRICLEQIGYFKRQAKEPLLI